MIRQFIRDTIADLANAVARSELAAENARLSNEVAIWKESSNDYAKSRDEVQGKLEESQNEADDLRERLEASEKAHAGWTDWARQALQGCFGKGEVAEQCMRNEFDMLFAHLRKEVSERRSPVDRSAAIERAENVMTFRWYQCGSRRRATEMVDAILGAQKAEPAKLTTAEAVAHICRELQSDEGYRIAWVANIAMQFKDRVPFAVGVARTSLDRDDVHRIASEAAEGFIELLCKDAQKEAPAEKPAAFVPAETSECSVTFVAAPTDEKANDEMRVAGAEAIREVQTEGRGCCPWEDLQRQNPEKAQHYMRIMDAIYALIARDHAKLAQENAAAMKRVRELEERILEVQDVDAIEIGHRDTLIKNCESKIAMLNLEHERLVREVARLSAPCPTDGMSEMDAYLAIEKAGFDSVLPAGGCTTTERNLARKAHAVVAKARELFGRPAK